MNFRPYYEWDKVKTRYILRRVKDNGVFQPFLALWRHCYISSTGIYIVEHYCELGHTFPTRVEVCFPLVFQNRSKNSLGEVRHDGCCFDSHRLSESRDRRQASFPTDERGYYSSHFLVFVVIPPPPF